MKRIRLPTALVTGILLLGLCQFSGLRAGPDEGVIRLKAPSSPQTSSEPEPDSGDPLDQPRRGFDHQAFESRLEALWFQRKTLLADGRDSDAEQQSQLIRAFCGEEGIRRLENVAGALVAEVRRDLEEGRYDRAADALNLAESVDPGRAQIRFARADLHWKSERGLLAATGEWLGGLRASLVHSVRDLSLFNQFALVFFIALGAGVLLFSVLMLLRHQVPFRHEIEERAVQFLDDRWALPAGWAALLLPLWSWLFVGWAAFYWIVATFRYMRRSERIAALALLGACVMAVPGYRLAVSIYSMTADPAVRTTLASAGGEYDPDRILELRQLVQAYPEDPVYRFLLAGLYKNGRYFEEAFAEYKSALKLDPSMEQAHINIGNIFFTTGQYAEAVANYGKALEIDPDSILAHFNLHLTQSESFRFKEAEASLARARQLDSKRLAEMLATAGSQADRPNVLDASIQITSVWEAALEGSRPNAISASSGRWLPRQFVNPVSIVALLALLSCVAIGLISHPDAMARRCIRCGRPFCHFCKSGREGKEYCSQCLHLYVLGDGLAHETKSRKLYEVERYEAWGRRVRKLLSLVLPGAAQILRGKSTIGTLLLLAWIAAWIAWQPILVLPLRRVAGLDLRLDLLGAGSVPAMYEVQPLGVLALMAMAVVWLAGNAWRWRGREA